MQGTITNTSFYLIIKKIITKVFEKLIVLVRAFFIFITQKISDTRINELCNKNSNIIAHKSKWILIRVLLISTSKATD